MQSLEKNNEVQRFTKYGMLGCIPFAILLFAGMAQIENEADSRAIEFGSRSSYHAIAIESFRECYKIVFDSKTSCLTSSIQLAAQSGLNHTSELAFEIRAFTDREKAGFIELIQAGWRYFTV
jgi:hypothetical protein